MANRRSAIYALCYVAMVIFQISRPAYPNPLLSLQFQSSIWVAYHFNLISPMNLTDSSDRRCFSSRDLSILLNRVVCSCLRSIPGGCFHRRYLRFQTDVFSPLHLYGDIIWVFDPGIIGTVLLDGLCNNGKLEKALVIFGDLQKSEMEIDIFTYSIMIEGMCKVGKVENGWDLFCSLSLKGVTPNVVTYTTMISGFCGKGLKDEADALFNKMKGNGPLPSSGTYNTLVRARLRDGDKAASAELIKEMRSCGFAGDASTIGLVTNMLHDGRLDKSFLDMLS